MTSWKTIGLESEYRFATALEAGKHGIDLTVERMNKNGEDSVSMSVEESPDPINAAHTRPDGARRLS
jgi:hypothetical protein